MSSLNSIQAEAWHRGWCLRESKASSLCSLQPDSREKENVKVQLYSKALNNRLVLFEARVLVFIDCSQGPLIIQGAVFIQGFGGVVPFDKGELFLPSQELFPLFKGHKRMCLTASTGSWALWDAANPNASLGIPRNFHPLGYSIFVKVSQIGSLNLRKSYLFNAFWKPFKGPF